MCFLALLASFNPYPIPPSFLLILLIFFVSFSFLTSSFLSFFLTSHSSFHLSSSSVSSFSLSSLPSSLTYCLYSPSFPLFPPLLTSLLCLSVCLSALRKVMISFSFQITRKCQRGIHQKRGSEVYVD